MLSSLFETQGYDVTREFYYNDAGVQISNLALSVQARVKGFKPGDAGWPEAAYNTGNSSRVFTRWAASCGQA